MAHTVADPILGTLEPGSPVSLVLLSSNIFTSYDREGDPFAVFPGTCLSLDRRACSLFTPTGVIHGVLGEYGQMYVSKENPGIVAKLADHCGGSTQSVADIVTDRVDRIPDNRLTTLSGMWLARRTWDAYTTPLSENAWAWNSIHRFVCTKPCLELLGFKKVEELSENPSPHNGTWAHPTAGSLRVVPEGTFTSARDLENSLPGTLDTSPLRQVSTRRLQFLSIREEIRDPNFRPRLRASRFILPCHASWNPVHNVCLDQLFAEDDAVFEDIVSLQHLVDNFNDLGKVFIPCSTPSEEYSADAVTELRHAHLAYDLLREKLAEEPSAIEERCEDLLHLAQSLPKSADVACITPSGYTLLRLNLTATGLCYRGAVWVETESLINDTPIPKELLPHIDPRILVATLGHTTYRISLKS